MLVLRATKTDVIRQLEKYSAALNGGKVKKSVFKTISDAYEVLNNSTIEKARYIELEEKEVEDIFTEYFHPLSMKNNIVASVYFGRSVSVYAKQKIESALQNAVADYTFPTIFSGDKIMIYLSYLDAACGELYDVDYALNLLNDYKN